MKKLAQLTTVIGASFAMLGCMTMQPLTLEPTRLQSTLKAGDHVEVVTANGQQLKFAVDSVDEGGLKGGGQYISYNDMRSISRNQVSAGKTALVVLGVVAAGALAAGASGGGGSGSY